MSLSDKEVRFAQWPSYPYSRPDFLTEEELDIMSKISDVEPQERYVGVDRPDDPWAHRSKTMCCKTCMWFFRKDPNGPVSSHYFHLGRCRRHAPTMSGYPAVFENDWCGDHKLDENKI